MTLGSTKEMHRWLRFGAGLGTLIVLLALVAAAWTVLAPDLLGPLASSDSGLVTPDSPLAWDAPSLSVAQSKSSEGELNRVVATAGGKAPGDVQLLDEWFYTAYLKYSSTAK